jgi:hypothetical protein
MSFRNYDFEEKLREAMEHYELPYEPSRWSSMEKRLNRDSGRDLSWTVAAAATVVVLGTAALSAFLYYTKDIQAVRSYTTPRMERFVPVDRVFAVRHSLHGEVSEITAADLLLFKDFDKSGKSAGETLSGRNQADTSLEAVHLKESAPGSGRNSWDKTAGPASVRAADARPLDMSVNAGQACAGTEIEFNVKNGPDKGSYLWNFGDGNFSNKPQPSHRYDKPGVFDVSLSVTDQNGSITTNVMSGMVTISPAPKADFTWNFVEADSESPAVKIINLSENASRFEWRFGDGSTTNAMNPVKSLASKGKQMVVLDVTNEWGCTDSKVKYIHVNNDYNLQAPEKIRVSKEVFMPDALRSGRMNFKLKIYTGDQVVYETSNRNKGWDGHLSGGELAADGQEFTWIVIVYNDLTREEKFFSGVLTAVNP